MVICDGCDQAQHIYCMNPPLEHLPTTPEWFCNRCWRFEIEEVVGSVRETRLRSSRSTQASGQRPVTQQGQRVQDMIDAVIDRINHSHVSTAREGRRQSRATGNNRKRKSKRGRKRKGRKSRKITVQKSENFENSTSTKVSTKIDKAPTVKIYGDRGLGSYEVDPTGGTSKQGRIPAPACLPTRAIDRKRVKMPPCPIRIPEPPKNQSKSFLADLLSAQNSMLTSTKYNTIISNNGDISHKSYTKTNYFK